MRPRVRTAKAQSIRAALRGKREITSRTTYDQFKIACLRLAAFDRGAVTGGRFATRTPWEKHRKATSVSLFSTGGPTSFCYPTGSAFEFGCAEDRSSSSPEVYGTVRFRGLSAGRDRSTPLYHSTAERSEKRREDMCAAVA